MPYDPKANRPKLVPADDPAPVDALLGPADAAPASAPAPAPSTTPAADAEPPVRKHLSVVPDADGVGAVEPTAPQPTSGRRPAVPALAAALLAAALVVTVVVVRRRA